MSRKTEFEHMLKNYGISLNTTEVAEVLSIHQRTAYKLQKNGTIKAFTVDFGSSRPRMKTMKEDLINYLLEQEKGATHDSEERD